MRINISIFYLFALIALSSCKKDVNGCKDSYASNYNSEATSDDGTCIYAIDNLVGKQLYRETDKKLFSFILDQDGQWVTIKCGERVIEGSYEIDYSSQLLSHYFNGIEEVYEIIKPTSASVRFRGSSNSNDDIAPENVLLVYETSYTPSSSEIENTSWTIDPASRIINITAEESDFKDIVGNALLPANAFNDFNYNLNETKWCIDSSFLSSGGVILSLDEIYWGSWYDPNSQYDTYWRIPKDILGQRKGDKISFEIGYYETPPFSTESNVTTIGTVEFNINWSN